METSLRLSSEPKSLRIHAKQKFHLDSNTLLQAHGEIDTGNGNPSYFALLIRQFLPQLSTRIGVGLQSDKHRKLQYTVRGKKAFEITSSGYFGLNIKGRCDLDKEFHKRKDSGGIELVWSKLNFQRDQDVRLKVGYELFEKVPYLQLKENNWTLNADMKGRWNVRYDL
ncbi:hypothetical protein IHE45_09G050300 [Dioscorea alata]|uniref:Uncharacterized protein n=2 Tax=Dioscorea alata TaxID=55571 RepID=A0ACB7VEW1_DIOAL|nr:hypothetical protein IHE45_09G050300 [Dioscorea alata]KAH7672373.1 hypothetical protein IHE45_09G050300 [Dioscorea alata]